MSKNACSHFHIYPHCYSVTGRKNAALYDIMQKRLFWLTDPLTAGIVRLSREGMSLAAIAARLSAAPAEMDVRVSFLEDMDLGCRRSAPTVSLKYRPFTQPWLERKSGYHRPLSMATLEISTECPGQCAFCRPESRLASSECACGVYSGSKEISYDVTSLIRSLSHDGTGLIELAGGDPYANRPMVEKAIRTAREHSIPVNVNTPGFLITREDLAFLKAHDGSLVLTLVDFDTADSEKTRLLGRIFAAINETAFERVSLRLMLGGASLENLDETMRWFSRHNAAIAACFTYYPPETRLLDRERFLTAVSRAVPAAHHQFAIGMNELPRTVKGHPCWQDRIAVMAGGEVRPCIASNLLFGNVHEKNILDILRDDRPEMITERRNIDNGAPCAGCEFSLGCISCSVTTQKVCGDWKCRAWNCAYDPATGSFANTAATPSTGGTG